MYKKPWNNVLHFVSWLFLKEKIFTQIVDYELMLIYYIFKRGGSMILNEGLINLDFGTIDFKQDLLNYIKENKIDYLLYFSIRSNMAIRLISVHSENLEIHFNYSEFINLEINKECEISGIIKSEDILIKTISNEVKPLIEGVLYEIYIPVKINQETIGCIYIGNINKKIEDINLNNLTDLIKRNIYELCKLENMKISYKAAIENTILIHELFKYKSLFMVNHIYNVASWAVQIAKRMKYSDDDLTKIYLAALLHDIGKIFIDENIVNKKGKLNEIEYNEIKRHATIGYNIIKDIFLFDSDKNISKWVLEHHERWDGKGYPLGLKGEEITKEARILKVADALDAMLSERSYKKQMDFKEAILELKSCRGKDFDPHITDIAIDILNDKLSASKQIFDEVMMPANIMVRTNKEIITLNGFVCRENNEIIFISTKPVDEIDRELIESIKMAVEKLSILYEYKIKVNKIDTNKLLITEIYPIESEAAFGLLWTLSGNLINTTTKQAKVINITKISGENLIFNFQEEEYIDENNIYVVVVRFEDGTNVPLSGRIVGKTKINRLLHYTFEFVDVREKYRDEVFRQIFRKQISLKRMLKE